METDKLTPKETVRALCVHCLVMCQANQDRIRDCEGDSIGCIIFPYRLGKRISVKTLRKYCIWCMGGSENRNSVEGCAVSDCVNYPYRMGTNPAYEGKVYNPNSPGAIALRLYHENRKNIVMGL
jgi:hypothetical protein